MKQTTKPASRLRKICSPLNFVGFYVFGSGALTAGVLLFGGA